MSTTLETTRPANGNGHSVALHDDDDYITRLARDPAIDEAKLRVLWEVQKDVLAERRKETSEAARIAYTAARARMQADMPVIGRDAQNPQTNSRYARLESIWEECCPVWTRHGFSVGFDVNLLDNGLLHIVLQLSHEAGHVAVFTAADTPPDNADAKGTINKTMVQANQSTVTYVKRGLLCNALGIVTRYEDDDGNAAPSQQTRSEPRQTRSDKQSGKHPVWRDIALRTIEQGKSNADCIAILTRMLPAAPSASEVLALANNLKASMGQVPIDVRDTVRKLIADRIAAFSTPDPSDTQSAATKSSDTSSDASGDFPPDLEWAEGKISELSLVFEMNTFLLVANDPKTIAKMTDLAEHNRPLFERVRAAFQQRQDKLAREAVR